MTAAQTLARRFRAAFLAALPRWLEARTSLFAAALAFHALLALAPILLVLLAFAGRMLGKESARASLMDAAARFAGPGADHIAGTLIDTINAVGGYTAGTVLGVALLLYFGSSFFAQLRAAFNHVWEVPGRGIRRALVARVVSYVETLVAVVAGLMVLAAGAYRSAAWQSLALGGRTAAIAEVAWTRLGTLAMTCAFLAAAFRFVPDVRPRPPLDAVLAGALPAAVALNAAGELFGLIIARSAVASLYGAAGSLIVFLLWVQYGTWIVLFGAEICRAWGEAGTKAGDGARRAGPGPRT